MTKRPYEPVAGTIPAKVLEYLRAHPDVSLSTSELSASIGQTGANLHPFMAAAVKAGAVVTSKGGDGRLTYWSLGSTEVDEPERPLTPAPPMPPLTCRSAFDYGGTPSPPSPPDGPLRVALWSDGVLQIMRGDSLVAKLDPEETRAIVRYLDRLAEDSRNPA